MRARTVPLALLILILAGCSTGPRLTMRAVPANTIVIENFAFDPGGVVVNPGATVTVINRDVTAHTVTAVDKEFDTGQIAPGKQVTFTAPSVPGKYHYLCMLHEYITGFLTVAGPAPQPPGGPSYRPSG